MMSRRRSCGCCASPGPRGAGRALGHIGLANYAGLATRAAAGRACSALDPRPRASPPPMALPLLSAAAVVALPTPSAAPEQRAAPPSAVAPCSPRSLRPGARRSTLVNVGYVALIAFGAEVAAANGAGAALGGRAGVRHHGHRYAAGRRVVAGPRRRRHDAAGRAWPRRASASRRSRSSTARRPRWPRSSSSPLARPSPSRPSGLLALEPRRPRTVTVPAAGLFFSWFDAGVGLGGPVVGLDRPRAHAGDRHRRRRRGRRVGGDLLSVHRSGIRSSLDGVDQ